MPRATVDYMNARRALMPASGGKTYDRAVEYCPDAELDPITLTELQCDSACADMHIAVEAMRYRLFKQFGITQQEESNEIPF